MKFRLTTRNWALFALITLAIGLALAGHLPSLGGAEYGLPLMGFGLSTSPFPVNPTLTAIAIGYKNPEADMIAERVLPEVPVAQKFSYTVYGAAQAFTVPDTAVGRKSEPNRVEFGGTLVQDEVLDYGLDDLIPNSDVEAWMAMAKPASGGPLDPRAISAMLLTHLVQIDREIRVANKVFALANYPAANAATLSGTSQWSDYTNSNPVSAIMAALDVCLVRPNKMVIGRLAWTKFRQHPKVVESIKASGAGGVNAQGIVARQAVADLFELEDVLIGGTMYNTAKPGQIPVYGRAWGKHCSLIHSAPQSAQLGMPTYGFTARFGSKVAGDIADPKAGLRGGVIVRSGESLKEVISAPDAGYFFQNATA
ncbi:MAG: capsid protein [Pseudomonadota bacterium]|nr:capsid protein [Pseudomonadota bacterium]